MSAETRRIPAEQPGLSKSTRVGSSNPHRSIETERQPSTLDDLSRLEGSSLLPAVVVAVSRGELELDELLAALGLRPLALSSTGTLHAPVDDGTACQSDALALRRVYGVGPTCISCKKVER